MPQSPPSGAAAEVRAAKARLRARVRSARKQRLERLSGQDRQDGERGDLDGERLAVLVRGLPEVAAARRVAAYVSMRTEPSTTALLRDWRAQGREVLLPVLLPDRDLGWVLGGVPGGVPDDESTPLGPDVIATADVIVVPALAVDRQGRRLGQGGGSYDRALARARPATFVVALLHPGELVDVPLPDEPHDHRVDAVITTDGVVRLVD